MIKSFDLFTERPAVRFLPNGRIDFDLSRVPYEFKHVDCPLCDHDIPVRIVPKPEMVKIMAKKDGETEWKPMLISKTLYYRIQKLFNEKSC